MDVRQLSRWVPYGPGGFIFACRVGRRGVYKAVTGGDKFDDYLELGRYRGYLKGPPSKRMPSNEVGNSLLSSRPVCTRCPYFVATYIRSRIPYVLVLLVVGG